MFVCVAIMQIPRLHSNDVIQMMKNIAIKSVIYVSDTTKFMINIVIWHTQPYELVLAKNKLHYILQYLQMKHTKAVCV